MTVEAAHPSSPSKYQFAHKLLNLGSNAVDLVSQKSPLIGAVATRSLNIAKPLVGPVMPLVNTAIDVADKAADKVYDSSVAVVSRVRDLRSRAEEVRTKKAAQFVSAACDAWASVHAHPGPVQFSELQAQLKSLYAESLCKPANQWDEEKDSVVLKVRRLAGETFQIVYQGVSYAVSLTENAVEVYLPEDGEVSVDPAVLGLPARVVALPGRVTRRLSKKVLSNVASLKLRTEESVRSLVHVDLIAYAAGQKDALAQYAKIQTVKVQSRVLAAWSDVAEKVPARARALKTVATTHAGRYAQQLNAGVDALRARVRGVLAVVDAERRAELVAALQQFVARTRAAAADRLEQAQPHARKALRVFRQRLTAAVKLLDAKLPLETRKMLLDLYSQTFAAFRTLLGDATTDRLVHVVAQNALVAWLQEASASVEELKEKEGNAQTQPQTLQAPRSPALSSASKGSRKGKAAKKSE